MHLIISITGAFLAIGTILWIFTQASQAQTQLDRQLQHSRQLARRQAALIQLNAKIAGLLDEKTISKTLLSELHHTLGYTQASLVLYGENGTPGLPIVYPPEPGAAAFAERHRLQNQAQTGGSVEKPRTEYEEVVLQAGNQKLGRVTVSRPGGQLGRAEDLAVVIAAVNQTALAIANARRLEQQRVRATSAQEHESVLRQRERRLTHLTELGHVTLRSQDLTSMLQTLADQLGTLFGADSALITLWDPTRGQAVPTAAFGPLRQVIRTLQIEPGDLPLTASVLEKSQPIVLEDAAASTMISRRLAAPLQSRSILALPLIVDVQKLGAVILSYQTQHKFSEDELRLGEQAANLIALAIAKVRALETAQLRAQELGALQEATAALLSTLDLEVLLGQILDAALSAIPAAEKGRLHLIARETGELQIRAVHGYSDPRINRFRSTDQAGIPARSVQERRPLLIHDTQTEPAHLNGNELPEVRAIAAMITAPLIYGAEVLGAISLEAYTRYAFSERDLQLLASFAATATMALQNAQLHAEVQRQAITDALTHIYNRRGFFELGWREVERARRFARPLAALMIDLDNFKQVNDQFGHPVGDQVLDGVATHLRHELRQIDLIGRYGGDEFSILLPETDLESAEQAGERLRRRLTQIEFASGVKIRFSVGVAALDESTDTLEKLIARADHALYKAKSGGKNRVAVNTAADSD